MSAEKRTASLSTLAYFASIVGIALTLAVSTTAHQGKPQPARTTPQAPAGTQQTTGAGSTEQSKDASLSIGKKVFVERCAKCHGEDGSAALPDGLPLSKRPLTEEQLTGNVNGRLKGRSEEERRAVLEYIKNFRKI